jgi:hypothetical protein
MALLKADSRQLKASCTPPCSDVQDTLDLCGDIASRNAFAPFIGEVFDLALAS